MYDKMKYFGNRLNSLILKVKILTMIDHGAEILFQFLGNDDLAYSARDTRRYKSFLGNKFITIGKRGLLNNCLPIDLKAPLKIADVGSADGSLIFELCRFSPNSTFYGADTGYKACFEDRTLPKNIKISDLYIYHPYYSPDGETEAAKVDLKLPQKLDVLILFDVVPYLDSSTLDNYFSQFATALTESGLLFVTCKIDTFMTSEISGNKGEAFQSKNFISEIGSTGARHGFEIIALKWGDWEKGRLVSDIKGADIVVFRKR